jgi:endonuclease YncB( thermonuclease family)
MGTAQRNNRLFFGLLALLSICLGVVCLMAFTTGGVLALRRAVGSRSPSGQPQTGQPSETQLPIITVTPTPLPSVSATFSLETATIPFEGASPTLEAIATTPSEPTQTPEPSQTSGPLAQDAWCVPWNSKTVRTQVLRVIDGITIEVELDGKVEQVRYIGVDLLEYDRDWRVWADSAEKNKQLVEGKTALLISDNADKDEEGRLARYVIVDGVFVNREMAASGYAIAQSTPPNTGCDSLLLEAETQAITAGLGLWAATPTPTRTFPPPTATISAAGDVVIVKVAFRGTPWQEPDEFVEIYNSGISPVQLDGWSVRDIKNHVFVFPKFVLGPGQYCRVYTNLYSRQHCGFSFFNPAPIWENDGDCAYLKDKTGKLVNQFCYE